MWMTVLEKLIMFNCSENVEPVMYNICGSTTGCFYQTVTLKLRYISTMTCVDLYTLLCEFWNLSSHLHNVISIFVLPSFPGFRTLRVQKKVSILYWMYKDGCLLITLSLFSDTLRCWSWKRWHASHGQQNPGDHHPLPSPKGSLCYHKQERSCTQSFQRTVHRASCRQYSKFWQRWGKPVIASVPSSFYNKLF